MSQLRVLVVGASIAGPTTAYWLARAGSTVTVIERFPAIRSGGQNVDIRTTAVTVMRRMEGMEEAVRATLYGLNGFSFVSEDGTPVATMKTPGDPDAQFLLSEYEIFRGDLARVLYDLTKDDDRIRYVFGEQVKAMKQRNNQDELNRDGPVTVDFLNGLAAVISTLLWPAMEQHLELALSDSTLASSRIDRTYGRCDQAQAFSAPGGRSAFIGPDSVKQHKGTKAMLVRNIPLAAGNDNATDEMREAVKLGDKSLKAYLDRHYRGMGWITDALLDDMVDSDDFYASEVMQVKLPQLFKGRFVVVGDAGYAAGPVGTGTSLAMTGAYVLAGELNRHKGDLAAGLASYQETMQPLIKEMQALPPTGDFAALAPQTAWGIWFRNTVFKVICWAMVFKGLFTWCASKYSVAFGKSEVNLPLYNFNEEGLRRVEKEEKERKTCRDL